MKGDYCQPQSYQSSSQVSHATSLSPFLDVFSFIWILNSGLLELND